MTRAEKAARKITRKHGVTGPPVDVVSLSENEGLPVTYHDLDDETSGMLLRDDDRALMAVNVNHHENRQRFTVSHELGHYLLHKDMPSVFVDDLLVHFRANRKSRRFDPREREANEFAACLLMPREFLRDDLSHGPIDISDDDAVRSLARRYKVSPQALTIRLMSLGLVGEFGDFGRERD